MKNKQLLMAAFLAANMMAGQTAFAAEAVPEKAAVENAAAAKTGAEKAAAESAVTENAPAGNAVAEEAVVEEAAVEEATGEEAAAEEAGEAPEDTSATAMGEEAGMPNPMLEYPDVPSLERAVGFPVYYLPGNLLALYHPAAHIYSIDRYVSEIRFQSKVDNSKITVRTALVERIGTDDISGYYGEWTQQHAGDVKRTQVWIARTATGMRVVRWTAGRFAFAITVDGVDDNTFRTMLKNFVAVADRFSHKYRNFRLNYKPKGKTNQLTEAAPEATETPAE